MKGKILGIGAISGDDGNRYGFELSDIANLNGKDENSIIGKSVDFEVGGAIRQQAYI